MRDFFFTLAKNAKYNIAADFELLLYFRGEESDFCRMNHNRIRQVGHVHDLSVSLMVIKGKKHGSSRITLTGNPKNDSDLVVHALKNLQDIVPHLPSDPHFQYNREIRSSEQIQKNEVPDSGEAIGCLLKGAKGIDLAGFYAGGQIYRGFANSLGQMNWFELSNFNCDWSLILNDDLAVKQDYCGTSWNENEINHIISRGRSQLEILKKPTKTITPGQYDVYLAPAAAEELLLQLCRDGFSLKSLKNKTSCLQSIYEERSHLNNRIQISDIRGEGGGPLFDSYGFALPVRLDLLKDGKIATPLVNPRSAKEFELAANCHAEYPEFVSLSGGSLSAEHASSKLGTGIYINNLWYLNFSDRSAGRITGMTRYANFWVEGGDTVAPIPAMRFDESLLEIFGSKLEDLTKERAHLIDRHTYSGRELRSTRVPGLIVRNFSFTL